MREKEKRIFKCKYWNNVRMCIFRVTFVEFVSFFLLFINVLPIRRGTLQLLTWEMNLKVRFTVFEDFLEWELKKFDLKQKTYL